MPLTWLPPRRYAIPGRPIATARGTFSGAAGSVFACSDGIFTGWGDAPDALTQRDRGRHRDAVERFAAELAELHLQAQQRAMPLADWLHARFPQWTVAPRRSVPVQALVDFATLRADPAQPALRALGLTTLKVKLDGTEPVLPLGMVLDAARGHGWRLRLDVNGGWQTRADRDALLAACAASGVEYVEDPFIIMDMTKPSVVAIAVDALDSSVAEVLAAARAGLCQVVVVKPPLWGSVARLLADVAALRASGVGVVLSSGLDGPVGLGHLAELAAVLPTDLAAGIATHLLWPKAWQPAALRVTAGRLHRAPPESPAHAPLAVVHAHAGELMPLTHGALLRQAHALAARLQDVGVAPGSCVATWAGNQPATLVAWQAVQLLGATWLPLHPRLTPPEIQPLLARATPRVLLAEGPRLRDLILDDCTGIDLNSLASLPQRFVLPQDFAPEATAALLFTSGSSGPAKGVQLPVRALRAAADAALEQFDRQLGHTWLCCLPICHVSGLLVLARAERLGMAVLLAEAPSTEALAALLTALPPRLASLVPAQLTRLLDADVPPPPGLLAVLIGGAACPPELVDRARAAGWPVLPSYGMTETAAQVATAPLATRLAPTPWPRAADAVCVGPAIAGVELRVHDGEILIRGAQLLTGYLGEAAPLVDGWLHTGDLGRLDDAGWLWVSGRRGELIVRGGENVTPDEVEAALLTLPGVSEACVVGVPDRVLGQRVAAWLTVAVPIAEAQLRTQLAGLARFKHPEIWLQTSEPLPRTGPGKIARGQVRARLADV